MDWWLIPIGLVVAVLLRLLWVAAFHPGETVSGVPELDSYVPGERSDAKPIDGTSRDPAIGTPSAVELSTESDRSSEPGSEPAGAGPDPSSVSVVGTGGGPDHEIFVEDDGIWIELDIAPLFSSSDGSSIVDVTDAEDPEVTS